MLSSTFLHGFATSAVQTEGGATADGKGDSVWDRYGRELQIFDQSTCETANDSYHLYEKDVELLQKLGANAYRFSLSWPRIVPKGGRDDPINEAGLAYYDKVINALVSAGITPIVTLFHWDTPTALDERYGAWRDAESISEDFLRYASVVFERFGDRVKYWSTINEPIAVNFFSQLGLYRDWNPETDSWKTAHSLIVTHAKVSNLYKTKYQADQGGKIGIVISADWVEPLKDTEACRRMAQRKIDYFFGIFADPIYLGEYPRSVKEDLGDKLPPLTSQHKEMLKGSCDYFGLNSYSASYALGEPAEPSPFSTMFGNTNDTHIHPGTKEPIGNPGEPFFLYDCPWGFRKMLRYVQERYLSPCNIPVIITENGFAVKDEANATKEVALQDDQRVHYFEGYLKELLGAIEEDGLNCQGYIAWTLADNWEWKFGWKCKYGVSWVDRSPEGKLERVTKQSGMFLKDFWEKNLAKA